MKKILLILIFASPFYIQAQSTDYDTATTDTWVSGNPANEAVSLVNQIICFLKNASGPNMTDFLGKKYKAVVYMDECEQSSGGSSRDESRGTGGSSSTAAQGDSSGSSNAAEEKKDAMIVINEIATRAADSDPIVGKAWVYMPDTDGGGGFDSFDRSLFLENTITSGVSTDNPYGAFTMNYTMTNTNAAWGGSLPAGSTVGEGYLNVSGTKAEFMERSFMQSEMQAYADFSQTEAGDVKGVIVKGGASDGAGPTGMGSMFKLYYAFNVDKSANLYCEIFLTSEKISFNQNALITAMTQDATIAGPTTALKPTVGAALTSSELETAGISTDAKCLSTEDSDKRKSVWQYGVYTQAGAEYTGADETKKAPFSIYAVNASNQELRGYASHWGVHVDWEVSDTDALAANWQNEQDSSDESTYKLFQNYGKLEKYTNSFLSLNDIHKVRFRLYIGWAYSASEKTKFNNLGFVDTDWDGADNVQGNSDDDYEEYEGYWDKDLQKFCFDTKISWRRSSNNILTLTGSCSGTSTSNSNTSGAVIVFSGTEWFTQMGDYQRIYAWSPETGTDYAIRKTTIENPTSRTSANGIKVQSREWVDIESISDTTFLCLRNCPTVSGVNASAKAALDAIQTNSGETLHASPYNSAIGPHFKAADYAATTPDGQITDFYGTGAHYLFQEGDYFHEEQSSVYLSESSNSDDVAIYKISSGKFYEGAGTPSEATEVTWSASVLGTEVSEVTSITDSETGLQPYAGMKMADLFMGHRIKSADYSATHSYRTRGMSWAIESGFLIENTEINRNKIRCDYASGTSYPTFGNNKQHPRIVTINSNQATDLRLCDNKIREGFDGTYYRFYLKPRAQWTIKKDNVIVNFFKPEIMYFDTAQIDTPSEISASGIQDRDKNKIIRLEFNGARQLWGLPGGVWDFCKDESLGDQVYNWNSECYRYVDRFVIPDGLNINTAADGSGTSYKVKALGIDEFLVPTSNPANIATMFDGLTKELLPSETLLKNLGPDGGTNAIGTQPLDSTLEESGKAQVIHGKRVSGT